MPSSPSPPTTAPGTNGYAWSVGTVVGRHLYVFEQSYNRGTPSPNSGQLWRWAPSQGGPPASNSGGGYNAAVANGHTAGIVLGLLLGIANLYFLVLLALNAGVTIMPSCDACSGLCGGLSSRAKGVSGFYASSSASTATSSGYTAPSSGPDL